VVGLPISGDDFPLIFRLFSHDPTRYLDLFPGYRL
jgi:hypothetical protein